MGGLVGRGICPFIIEKMRKRHVAHAQRAKHSQHADVISDHVAALHADQRGDFSLRVSAAYLFGGTAEHHIFRILTDVFVHSVNLVEGQFYRARAHDAAINPDGKENRIHTAFAHARNVYVAVGIAPA